MITTAREEGWNVKEFATWRKDKKERNSVAIDISYQTHRRINIQKCKRKTSIVLTSFRLCTILYLSILLSLFPPTSKWTRLNPSRMS